ncbi:hypothetical protein [Marinomonas shanghaiensis]|uniref:hypothetical protein n=1 Tax=Marinomonas shanghaiensis TaxID=2202418 RepID=UPI003A8C9262
MNELKIASEEDACALLEKLVSGFEIDANLKVEFDSWPKFVIRIKGEDFDGTIPTRIMPNLIDLQKEVHRIYCLTQYGEDNTRKLTKQDKEDLELLVKVDKGSSIFETLLNGPMGKLIENSVARMTPEQITAVAIVFGLAVTSVAFWKLWLQKQSKDSELNHTLELSRLEKEKMELIQKAAQKFPETKLAADSMDNVRNEFLSKMKPKDFLYVDTGTKEQPYPTPVELSGEQASSMTKKPREKAIERMINGDFFLKTVNFNHQNGVRAELERSLDGYCFRADIPIGVLGHDQLTALKNNSWDQKNITMSLLVKELNGAYTSAKVISVKELSSE